jgi:transposase
MARGRIELDVEDRELLESWSRGQRVEHRLRIRSQIILKAAEGCSGREISKTLSIPEVTVSKWRRRFLDHGIAGLEDAPRSGKPTKYDEVTVKRVLELLDRKPPAGYGRWNGRLMAQQLADVTPDQVWRILRQQGIELERRHSWCISTDPEFARKAADIVGLYLNPPQNALILAIDEKPAIQALERAQGWIRLPNGKALTGFNHEYKRHGTSTLFAALNIASGQIQAGHFRRRRRREFLEFMNRVLAEHPDQEIHVVLDNLSSHKPKEDRWLRAHPNVHFHFTPTHASWLNQVEIWFSILSRQALRGASFTSVVQLRQAIDEFITAYNRDAAPFEWTKSQVHQVGVAKNISNLRK